MADLSIGGFPQMGEGTGSYGNKIFYGNVLISPAALVAGAFQNVTEQSVTVAGLLATDMVLSINKPTTQLTIALLTGRVSAASVLKLTFSSGSASVTPTASEVYQLAIFRPSL